MAAGRKTGGRTKGVPNKATADVKEAAMAFTSDAIQTLASIMRDTQEAAAARVAAARELLDRGHGKSRQSMDIDATVQAEISEIRRTIVDPRHPDA